MPRIIAHLDMDAFFASVEERDKPYLKGRPIVVGADPKGGEGRGVAATANYKARAYGIHSAIPISRAWNLAEAARKEGKPMVAFIVPSGGRYGRASREVFDIVRKRYSKLEQTSVDEGYIDLSHLKSYKRAEAAMRDLRKELRKKTKLPASVGIAQNKMLAKLSSERAKPDGLSVLRPSEVERALAPLPVSALPGIGRKTEELLNRRGIKTVADARKLSWQECERLLGSHGFSFYGRLWGNDDREVATEHEDAKSVGVDETFERDIYDVRDALPIVEAQAKEVHRRLTKEGFMGFRTAGVVVRFSDFSTFTRAVTEKEALRLARDLELRALTLLLPFFDKRENPRGKGVRLIGLRVSKLTK
jgi:DNA polymerase IV (archaeal DinB-like DNA polymerase)